MDCVLIHYIDFIKMCILDNCNYEISFNLGI